MEIMPEPKNVNDKLLEFLKELMGEDGLTFLDLDNAITAVKQGHWVWQAPFAIGLRALPLLYHWGTDSRHTAVPDLALLVLALASQVHVRSEDMAISDLVNPALEPLEAKYNSLTVEIHGYGLGDEQARMLFHIRFALGVLLLLKGDEERAKTILRQMAATRTTRRGQTWSSEGLGQFDVGVTKALAAIIFQDFYEQRQDYEMALYLLTEAVASNGPGPFSESLLAVVSSLLEPFAEKCERLNDFGEWVALFDRATDITELCGEVDASGELPSDCKVSSPQFLAWKFGQLAARFTIRNGPLAVDSILRAGGYGDDWNNGTVVASLLCEYDEHRNWQILRQQYVSIWESSSRYQWLPLCQAGAWTDLYWAMRIGFADQMLSATEQIRIIQLQTEPSLITRDIEMTKNIVSTLALRQLTEQSDIDKMLELLQKLVEGQPPNRHEIAAFLEQQFTSVWEKLPSDVADTLIEAEHGFRNGVYKRQTVLDFHHAVEKCLRYYFVNPLLTYMAREHVKEMTLRVRIGERGELRNIQIGVDTAGESSTTHPSNLSLSIWAALFEALAVPGTKGTANLSMEMFLKQNWPKADAATMKQLGESLRIIHGNRNNAAHPRLRPRMEENKELKQTRNLVLGMNGPSVITQIFQLFYK
jgi:tetratricopeptide (TPR) repeat protein